MTTQIRHKRAANGAPRFIPMSTVFSIDSTRHYGRIANIARQRTKPDQQPKQPARALKFRAVTACLIMILRSPTRSLSGYELENFLATDYKICLDDDVFNAVMVVVARYLRKELKEANRLDAKQREIDAGLRPTPHRTHH